MKKLIVCLIFIISGFVIGSIEFHSDQNRALSEIIAIVFALFIGFLALVWLRLDANDGHQSTRLMRSLAIFIPIIVIPIHIFRSRSLTRGLGAFALYFFILILFGIAAISNELITQIEQHAKSNSLNNYDLASSETNSMSQCTLNTDCKGNRICKNGACEFPTTNTNNKLSVPSHDNVLERHVEQPEVVQAMDIDDLKVDIESLIGQKIRVRGVGIYIMNSFYLKKNTSDTNVIALKITNLQRDQRKKILQNCSDILYGCNVVISGSVSNENFQIGIDVDNLEWLE